MPDATLKTGDTRPPLEATLTVDGTAVDLTGATVRFRMRNRATDSLAIDASATVVDAAGGVVVYEWAAGDLNSAGGYAAEFAVDFSGATGAAFDGDQTFPNDRSLSIRVLDDLT